MNKKGRHKESLFNGNYPIHRVGIIYCTSQVSASGREIEKRADFEVIEVAQAVKSALASYGYHADLVDLDPTQIAGLKEYDWVFNLTESIYGYPISDYEITEQMEKYGIGFTGSGAGALRTCLDKAATKCELLRNGIDTPAYEVFQPHSSIFNMLDYPLIVKPLHEDGSIGITTDSIARNASDLEGAIERVHHLYQQPALVEEFIEGRDITASVIGNGPDAVILPLSEITYPEQVGPQFLTFNAKWVPDTFDYQNTAAECPCNLERTIENRIKDIALRSFQAVGCQDYARVDFRLRGEIPFVLEVNPNPCINPDDSGFVRSSKAAGYSYEAMVAKILMDSVRDRLLVRNGPKVQ